MCVVHLVNQQIFFECKIVAVITSFINHMAETRPLVNELYFVTTDNLCDVQ